MSEFIDFDTWYIQHYCIDCVIEGKKALRVEIAKNLYKSRCLRGDMPKKDSDNNDDNKDMTLPSFIAYETIKAQQDKKEPANLETLQKKYSEHLRLGTVPKNKEWKKLEENENRSPEKPHYKPERPQPNLPDDKKSSKEQRLSDYSRTGNHNTFKVSDLTKTDGKIDAEYILKIAQATMAREKKQR